LEKDINYNLVFESSLIMGTEYFIYINSIIVILGIIFIMIVKKNMYLKDKTSSVRIKSMIVALFFIIFNSMSIYGYVEFHNQIEYVKNVINKKKYIVIEGEIKNLKAMPTSGHTTEDFDIGDVHFKISFTGNSPDDKTLFYTMTKYRDGPIQKNGQKVKIYYIEEAQKKLCIPFLPRCLEFNGTNEIIKMWKIENFEDRTLNLKKI